MTTFTITTDNVAVVKAIMANIDGMDDIQVTAAAPVTPTNATSVNPATDTHTPVTPVITSDVVAGIIKTLADMSADDLTSTFGAGYDKPEAALPIHHHSHWSPNHKACHPRWSAYRDRVSMKRRA